MNEELKKRLVEIQKQVEDAAKASDEPKAWLAFLEALSENVSEHRSWARDAVERVNQHELNLFRGVAR